MDTYSYVKNAASTIPALLGCSLSAPGLANLCSSLLTGPSLGEVFIKLVFYASHFQLEPMKFLRIATRNSGKWLFVVNSTKQHLKLNSCSFPSQALLISEIPLINILTLYTIKRSPGFLHPFPPFPHWNTYLFLMCRRLKKFVFLTLKMFLKNHLFFFFLIKESKLTSVQTHLIWLSFCWAKDWNYAYYVSGGQLSPTLIPKTDFHSTDLKAPQGLEETGLV